MDRQDAQDLLFRVFILSILPIHVKTGFSDRRSQIVRQAQAI
jgi:hypothetical protein